MRIRIPFVVALLLFSFALPAFADTDDEPPPPPPPPPGLTITATDNYATTTVATATTTVLVYEVSDDEADITFSISIDPINGTLGSISGNTVDYIPNAGFTGTDSFTFRVDATAIDLSTAFDEGVITIVVQDVTAPVFTISPVDQSFGTTTFPAIPTLVFPTVTDDTDVSPSLSYDILSFSLGTTTITWTATDDAGNSATATSSVGIYDTTPPPPPPAPEPTPTSSGNGAIVGSAPIAPGFTTPTPPAPEPTPPPVVEQTLALQTEVPAQTPVVAAETPAPAPEPQAPETASTGEVAGTSTEPIAEVAAVAESTDGFSLWWLLVLLALILFGTTTYMLALRKYWN